MSDLKKTCYIILNHNVRDVTTTYYEELEYYQEQDNFDLLLIDNGSRPSEKSVYTTHSFKKNVYFNGAIQWSFQYMLDHPEYDYLVFSNNDIFLHGYKFVRTMIEIAEENNFTMVSPSTVESNGGQNFWPIMHCWYKNEPRVTPWIDFTCPFIHRRLIEEIKQFPDWWRAPSYGFDDYCAIICDRKGWKVGVSDLVTVHHIGAYTYKLNKASDGLDFYTMQGKHRENFDWNFEKSGLKEEHYALDNKKALYGRHNSMKMGRMPATPDEGYGSNKPNSKLQWFRNSAQEELSEKRRALAYKNYNKGKR